MARRSAQREREGEALLAEHLMNRANAGEGCALEPRRRVVV
jgi:hypothetical protein